VQKLKIAYPIATGDPDRLFAWTAKLGNVSEGLPFSVLLDASGNVRWVKSGGRLTTAEVTELIARYAASSAGPGATLTPN
jgi:hypothetical protein